jgi:hypothetical protein
LDLVYAKAALTASQAHAEATASGRAPGIEPIWPLLSTDVIRAYSLQKEDEDRWVADGCELIAKVRWAGSASLADGQAGAAGFPSPGEGGCLAAPARLLAGEEARMWPALGLGNAVHMGAFLGHYHHPPTPGWKPRLLPLKTCV